MQSYMNEAKQLEEKITKYRRDLHQIPELGLDLPKTKSYIMEQLDALQLEYEEVGTSGISVLIRGKEEGKTILLRADMDALPMQEENDLPFKATGQCAHTCGHDLHAAMLLGAAEIINNHKDEFAGNVKLMFQPAEEIFKGSEEMIANGILENPKVDAAIAFHTGLDDTPGSFGYYQGNMTTSSDNFKITITGKGGHGAYPHTTIDPIYAGMVIRDAFNQMISYEITGNENTTLTLGQFAAGSNANIIPEVCTLQGTTRSYIPENRNHIMKRMEEIMEGVEKITRTKIDFEILAQVPPLYSDPEFTEELVHIMKEAAPEIKGIPNTRVKASEDMANISVQVPTAFFMMNCKVEGNDFSHHNPEILFDEKVLPIGSGSFATLAIHWLNSQGR